MKCPTCGHRTRMDVPLKGALPRVERDDTYVPWLAVWQAPTVTPSSLLPVAEYVYVLEVRT